MKRLAAMALLLNTLFCISSVRAAETTFAHIFVFGDSLSDSGNVFSATGGLLPPHPPYAEGRFSDGLLWVEHLSDALGLSLIPNGPDPTVLSGNNFAVGGARNADDLEIPGWGTIPSIASQVDYFANAIGTLPPDSLYVVSGGYNDVRMAADPFLDLSGEQRLQVVSRAVDGVYCALQTLADGGAEHLLVANMADLGLTPEAKSEPENVELASQMTQAYNASLASSLDRLEAERSIQVYRLDVFDLAYRVVADARDHAGAVYGITNLDVPIFEGVAGSPGADPAVSLFADALHISAAAHRHLGHAAAAIVPEPSAEVLIATLLPLCIAFCRWNADAARVRSTRGANAAGPRAGATVGPSHQYPLSTRTQDVNPWNRC